jgi:tripartite-type tricarboxylate transporter receptor subunit TctC
MLKRGIVTACALVALALGLAAHAQQWPARAVKLVNPYAAGGGVDAFGRPIAAKLTQQLGQTFFVENISGAGGTVGAAAAAKSPPDGYTFFIGAIHHTIAESIYPKLPYNIERDFEPVTVIAYVPNVIVMHPKHEKIRTLRDLIDHARANPGMLNFGSAGNGTTHHLVGELFKLRTGTQLVHVPYRGAGPMMQDLLAGNIDMAFDGMATSAPQIKGGKLRPLAVSSAQRSPFVPEVPTMREMGVADFEVMTWYAIWAVKGTPKEIVERMYQEVAKALRQPDLQKIWEMQGATVGGEPPAQMAKLVASEVQRWRKVVQDAKVKLE